MKLTNIELPRNGIRMEEVSTTIYINNNSKGVGTLFITEENIVWVNNMDEGIIIKYPDVSLFAVCTDREKYEENCIFMLVKDEEADDETESVDSDEDDSNETEVRFAPPGGVDVHDLFNVIQECNKLHPNENDDMVSDSNEDNSEDDSGLENDNILNGNVDHEQFEDAEMN
ncbi:hypothetical protein PGB90_007844 [Kerria lacca]